MNTKRYMITGITFYMLVVIPMVGYGAEDTVQLAQKVNQLEGQVSQLQQQLAQKEEDPFREMEWMQQQMVPEINNFEAKVDMKQMDNQYVVTMDLPGMKKDKINVEARYGVLMISGERTSESEENKGNHYFLKERSFGNFMQNLPLPDDAKIDHIDAQYNNGVLKIIIPRERKNGERSDDKKIIVR